MRWLVEDAPHGIEAARRAGGRTCQVGGFGEVDYFLVTRFLEQVEQQVAVS